MCGMQEQNTTQIHRVFSQEKGVHNAPSDGVFVFFQKIFKTHSVM